MTLSAYEQDQWDRLQEARAEALSRRERHLLPEGARSRMSSAAARAQQSRAGEMAEAAYISVANETGKILGTAASHTVSNDSVVREFTKAGHEVSSVKDIRDLDLEVIDSVIALNRIRYGHSGLAAATGLVSGGVITGGQIMLLKGSVHGQGAKQAPSIGVVTSVYAADLAAQLGLAARTVAATARYYGYDPQEREEQIFMMSVIQLGMATGTTAKSAAYAELSQLTQLLFRDATWAKLSEKILTKIAQQFASMFAVNLTKKKFGQFVPLAGPVIGAALSWATLDRVAAAANDAYRERFLVEKAGGFPTPLTTSHVRDETAPGILELLEAEDVLPEAQPPALPTAETD